MGSINRSHNESDGGVLLFQGELILLFCDSVDCQIGGKTSVKGRLYLTTHRIVLIVAPYKPTSAVKSLSAPFCAITKIKLEQPTFGANYIEATVTDESDRTKTFTFKLKFNKGGACEFAMAMNRAVSAVSQMASAAQAPPPSYSPSPTEQFYQAPPTVYAPGYNCGVQMPLHQFPDQPPIGFIYTSSAPPPYPGLSNQQQQHPGHQQYPQAQQQYPQAQQQYPQAQQQYPQAQQQFPQAQQQQYPQAQQQQYPQAQQQQYPQANQQQQNANQPQLGFNLNPNAPNAPSAPEGPPPPYA